MRVLYILSALAVLIIESLYPSVSFAISSPLQLTPSNQEILTANPTLTWQEVTEAIQYRVIVDDEETAVSPYLKSSYKTTTTYSPELDPGTYYWKVGAKDGLGEWFWSSVWSFTIPLSFPSPVLTPITPSPPTPTPIRTPAPINTPTPKRTPTPITPESTNTPTSFPAPSKSVSTQITATALPIKPKIPSSLIVKSASVAGIASSSPSPTPIKVNQASFFSLPHLFTLSGGAILILTGIFIITFFAQKRPPEV